MFRPAPRFHTRPRPKFIFSETPAAAPTSLLTAPAVPHRASKEHEVFPRELLTNKVLFVPSKRYSAFAAYTTTFYTEDTIDTGIFQRIAGRRNDFIPSLESVTPSASLIHKTTLPPRKVTSDVFQRLLAKRAFFIPSLVATPLSSLIVKLTPKTGKVNALDFTALKVIQQRNTLLMPANVPSENTIAPFYHLKPLADEFRFKDTTALARLLAQQQRVLFKRNIPPTDVLLDSNTVNITAGLNAHVGYFSTTDVDTDDTFQYALVVGIGDDDNASFSITGNELLCNDPASIGVGAYSIRIESDDGSDAPLEKVFTIFVAEGGDKFISGIIDNIVDGIIDGII